MPIVTNTQGLIEKGKGFLLVNYMASLDIREEAAHPSPAIIPPPWGNRDQHSLSVALAWLSTLATVSVPLPCRA